VGGEFFSLPAQTSRVNGQPQVYLPPLLDRGIAVVQEFTKQSLTSLSSNVPQNLKRVGNIISQVYLVPRNSSGARIGWTGSGGAITAGTRINLSYDQVPLMDADPQHLLDKMQRTRPRGQLVDTGVLTIIDRRAPAGQSLATLGTDGGLDKLLQTAQTTALSISANWNTSNVSTVDVYTSDITVTNLVTGEKYSFAYGGQLLLPAQQSLRS
ncbi:MAG TPA: hypothetical protein VFG23_12320, partial [Polyangia bacterium]|nr:hypothetical protein [Polyangia bacterium]